MPIKLVLRLSIDLAMTILLLCSYAYRIIGDTAHEWIGISLFVLFIAHNLINRDWYKNIFKGKYTLRRLIMTAVNIALVFVMAIVIATGLLHSRTVLAFLHLPGGMALRLTHTTAAYWSLIVIAVHISLHWGMILNAFRKMAKINEENRQRKIILRIITLAVVVFGVWASFDRDMFSKLFLGYSFDYWPDERPAVLFFVAYFLIIGMYVSIAYYAVKVFDRLHQQNNRGG